MAEILHLRCHHCGGALKDRQSAYCPPCNLHLFYRAMPILLGMMMAGPKNPCLISEAVPVDAQGNSRRLAYAHSKDILD